MESQDNLKPDKLDWMHTIVKSGLAAVPIAGGPLAELLATIVVPPLSRRRDEWISSIASDVKALEERFEGFKAEQLSHNDKFITALMHATQSAVRNHQEEKLQALRNAVLNAALPNAPEEDLELMFLSFVDTLTTWHLRLLKFFDDPNDWLEKNSTSLRSVQNTSARSMMRIAFPSLDNNVEFSELLLKDLDSKGLLYVEGFHMTIKRAMEKIEVTGLGKQFLDFITSPFEK